MGSGLTLELCAVVVYAVWLLAGAADFHLHRRTDLPHTSGLRESALHGVQLGLVGIGVLAWLVFAPSRAVGGLLLGLAVVHAAVAWLDTVSADGRRRIAPLEQHVHSVLDASPWLFAAGVMLTAPRHWDLHWQPRPVAVWIGLVLPAVLLAVLPWLLELKAAWQCRARSASAR